MNVKNAIIISFLVLFVTVLGGCGAGAGILGNLSSERDSEKNTPAEFDLSDTEGKIAILVNQPGWIKTPVDLRVVLTNGINFALTEKVEIPKARLFEYTEVLNSRMKLAEEINNEPNALAPKIGAEYVLDVQIMDFDLSTFAERDFFNGLLTVKACLLDAKGEKLWPEGNEYRTITVQIEDEKGTIESSVAKLSAAAAHCITRYFYDCKMVRFHIQEEKKDIENYDF
ncbi:MAG: hypothetical protein BWY69_00580 [Planctomycetes bacterium ADurb.Bin401]|jgi:hypothetical protein|nr:MAG: hypothetical protein BWY69_00580 [Planctomycetes bacterium ADurb.Bin401]